MHSYGRGEHLWKNLKKRSTHLRYFPTFEALTGSVEEGLAYYGQHPEAVYPPQWEIGEARLGFAPASCGPDQLSTRLVTVMV